MSLPVVLLAATVLSAQQDPRWVVVPDVNGLEISVTPSSTALAKSLHEAAEHVLRWQVVTEANTWWEGRRPVVDNQFKRTIGLLKLPPRTPLNARVLGTHDFGDYSIRNIVFESRPGFPVTANLYSPTAPAKGKRPAIVSPTGHHLDTGKNTPEVQARCIRLARMGFVVLTYDPIGHGERLVSGNIHHEAGYALLPLGETIAGWMVWDSMRAADYLETLDTVDPKRLGITGNSGGGLNTLFTAAIDERFQASAISGYVFDFNNWIKYGGPHCTCTQLPNLYRSMEWFEIAGLIASRPVLMLQGERDEIFPVSGAAEAGRKTVELYERLGFQGLARMDVIPGEPHAYSRPFRERMYGWMAQHLLEQGDGRPMTEQEIKTLDPKDRRLLCDPEGTLLRSAPTVVDLARQKGREAVSRLPAPADNLIRWVTELTANTAFGPDYLGPERIGKPETTGSAILQKVFFLSEIGQYIPGLLWLPKDRRGAARTVIVVDDRGKAAVAESAIVEPLVASGLAVLAVDLRGRGETMGHYRGRGNNFHYIGHSILYGLPVAGRRAFDLKRTVDFLSGVREVTLDGLTVAAFGDDALPAILAAATDRRIARLAIGGYDHSFMSQMAPANLPDPKQRLREWNMNAMRTGRIDNGSYQVDLGSVIPGALAVADIADLLALIAPRRVLFADARDRNAAWSAEARNRLRGVVPSITYQADKPMNAASLVQWLGER